MVCSDSSSNYTQLYVQNSIVNLFPLLTYQKIYQDFFRWSQWERSNPSSYNVDYFTGVNPHLFSSVPPFDSDYWKSDTMFDLRYCNWNKDMLMGVLPNSQFGDVAVIDLPSSVSNVQVADTSGALHPSRFLLILLLLFSLLYSLILQFRLILLLLPVS